MKIKLIGILICTTLISSSTTFALTPFTKDEKQMKNQFYNIPSMSFPKSIGWMKTFGGTQNDRGRSVQQTTDGGYIVIGSCSSYGAGKSDVWLIKINSDGTKAWDKTFGGSNDDGGDSIQQTTDGGYIITGNTWSYGEGKSDVWLIKTDSKGNKIWDKTFGGTGYDWSWSVKETTDAGYVIIGQTASYGSGGDDVWLIKTDSNGDKLWDRTYGGIGYDCGWSVQQTTDDGYIITGETWPVGINGNDVWLIKTDASGNKIWDKTFGGVDMEWGVSVQQTMDNGYIIAGGTWSFGAGIADLWLIKTDNNGNKIWDKTFGGTEYDTGWSVQQTTDGGYIIAGYTYSSGAGSVDFWLIKTDDTGNKIWDRTFGGTGEDSGFCVQQCTDGGYIIIGETESFGEGGYDVWLIKTDAQGNARCTSFSCLSFPRFFYRFFHGSNSCYIRYKA